MMIIDVVIESLNIGVLEKASLSLFAFYQVMTCH